MDTWVREISHEYDPWAARSATAGVSPHLKRHGSKVPFQLQEKAYVKQQQLKKTVETAGYLPED